MFTPKTNVTNRLVGKYDLRLRGITYRRSSTGESKALVAYSPSKIYIFLHDSSTDDYQPVAARTIQIEPWSCPKYSDLDPLAFSDIFVVWTTCLAKMATSAEVTTIILTRKGQLQCASVRMLTNIQQKYVVCLLAPILLAKFYMF